MKLRSKLHNLRAWFLNYSCKGIVWVTWDNNDRTWNDIAKKYYLLKVKLWPYYTIKCFYNDKQSYGSNFLNYIFGTMTSG
jgi:hypothetical protein